MKPNLAIYRGTITVAQLRADRSLRPDIIGVIHPELRGEIPAGARGNLDACELTDDERAAVVNIADLIASN